MVHANYARKRYIAVKKLRRRPRFFTKMVSGIKSKDELMVNEIWNIDT